MADPTPGSRTSWTNETVEEFLEVLRPGHGPPGLHNGPRVSGEFPCAVADRTRVDVPRIVVLQLHDLEVVFGAEIDSRALSGGGLRVERAGRCRRDHRDQRAGKKIRE